MRAGRLRRTRLRTSKAKRAPQKSGKRPKASPRGTQDQDESTQLEPAHSLLLSSLRFWEVERDLIEERISAIGR
jgi:hypothetical protein